MPHPGRANILPAIIIWTIPVVNGAAVPPSMPQSPITVKTPAYTAVFDPAAGGLLGALVPNAADKPVLQSMQIYTDYGVYSGERGYVGTRSAVPVRFVRSSRAGSPLVIAEGVLHGKPAAGRPPTRYRIETLCRPGGLHIRAGIRPGVNKKIEASAFLALQWGIAGLREFAVHTAKGIVRKRYLTAADLRERAYQARLLPLDPGHPDLDFITDSGVSVHLRGLKTAGIPLLTGPVVHGHSVFLCWLDGPGRRLEAGTWGWVEFDLRID